jgi:hypothetical protein
MSPVYAPAGQRMRLSEYREYDDAVLDLCRFFVSLAPPEVEADARHVGYEPMVFGGMFPTVACFEQPFEDEPKRVDNTIQPGVINLGFRIYLPSVVSFVGDTGEMQSDFGPRSGAQLESMRLHARFRENLFDDESYQNFNFGGRVYRIRLVRGEGGDMDRMGLALAVDYGEAGTETLLWVHHTDIRVEL